MISTIFKTVARASYKSIGRTGISRAFAEVSSYENLKVNHYSRQNTFDYVEVFNAVAFASNSERMAEVISVAAPLMTDQLLALALRTMEQKQFQLGEGFHQKLLPFIRIFTKRMDLNHTAAFAECMVSMGNLGVKDPEYWEICKNKLIDQHFRRYVPLRNLGHLIKALANVGQADPELMRSLGAQVIKHQASLKPDNIQAAIEGFEMAGIGGENFKKALAEGSHKAHTAPLQLH